MKRRRLPAVILFKRTVGGTKGRHRTTYWVLKWPGTDGRARTEFIGRTDQLTAKQAADMRDEKTAALFGGTALRDPSQISVAEFLQADRDELATTHRPATVNAHRRDTNRLLGAVDDMALDAFGWAEVAKFKKTLSARGCRPATIASAVAGLKAAWNRARTRKLVTDNPWIGAVKVRTQAKTARIFSEADIAGMLDKTDSPWWVAFITLAYATGLRFGEILNLTWEDVDRTDLTVTVNAHHASKSTLEWESKSHQQRVLPVDRGTLACLLRLKVQGGSSPYLFLSSTRLQKLLEKQHAGTMPEPSHWLNNTLRDFKALQDRAGLDEPRGCIHDLRKSFGTRMSQHVTMPELQKLMGHASITTTADYYVSVPADLAERVRHIQADRRTG